MLQRLLVIIMLSVVISGCTDEPTVVADKTSTAADSSATHKHVPSQDPVSWIDDLKTLRDALYAGDRQKVKSYFSFPVQTENNELWYFTDSSGISDPSMPFTERDFEQSFSRVFPKALVKSLMKIKTALLFEKGAFETPVITEGDSLQYRLFAAYDKKEGTLSLNLAYDNPIPGEEEERDEFNIIYTFSILPDGRLRFNRVNLAG